MHRMTPVELVCFHHAGGGAASFHPLRRALTNMGAEVALTAVTLPGRESRRDEPRHVDAETCVRALADELDELLRRPHVLLGHSMGAILAYLLAQQRISRGTAGAGGGYRRVLPRPAPTRSPSGSAPARRSRAGHRARALWRAADRGSESS